VPWRDRKHVQNENRQGGHSDETLILVSRSGFRYCVPFTHFNTFKSMEAQESVRRCVPIPAVR
jgi:hypothetical protein